MVKILLSTFMSGSVLFSAQNVPIFTYEEKLNIKKVEITTEKTPTERRKNGFKEY
ncbi:MAG: hypothetical protein HDR44_03250 [Allobaculum sp.]|nr:hypothetical protein [Allobaculum sp.]